MSSPRYLSPLRYPGGKARMAPYLAALAEVQWTGMDVEVWMEPFAGGAGAGLGLLEAGAFSEVWLVEKHPALAAFWAVVATEGDALAAAVEGIEPDLARWEAARETVALVLAGEAIDPMRVALDTFILNRCSRSGIVTPVAGPIGGKHQTGRHRLGDRWNGPALGDRIRRIAAFGRKGRLRVHHADAIDMIAGLADSGIEDELMLFVDPPYIREGNRLYQQGMDESQHVALSDALHACPSPWILTYDDEPDVRDRLYPDHRIVQYRIANTANTQRRAWEYAVLSPNLELPGLPGTPPTLLPADDARWVPPAAA